MIYDIFKYLSERLNEHLKVTFKIPEDLVEVASLGHNMDVNSDTHQNAIVMSLINIERETAMGIQVNRKHIDQHLYKKMNPSWHLNLTFMLASVSDSKQYLQSLRLLSSSLDFFQNENVFIIRPATGEGLNLRITVEPMNATYQELSNIWSLFGGKYYPSLIGKIRMLTIDSNHISSIERSSEEIIIKPQNIG